MPTAHEPVVVVGIDGSESSKRALRWAVRQAELTRAQFQSQAGRRWSDVLRALSARRLSEVARTSRASGTNW